MFSQQHQEHQLNKTIQQQWHRCKATQQTHKENLNWRLVIRFENRINFWRDPVAKKLFICAYCVHLAMDIQDAFRKWTHSVKYKKKIVFFCCCYLNCYWWGSLVSLLHSLYSILSSAQKPAFLCVIACTDLSWTKKEKKKDFHSQL